MRGATLFSGGGGVEALLKERINFVHAVEYDPAIAAVYRANHGDHIQVARVEDVDYSLWGALDYGHASPVCKEFSQAKTGGTEGDTDIQSALAVVRFLECCTPRVFTLENVGAYQHSKSYRLICRALDLAGYMWHAEVLNSADFGVPQTRRRLILRAVRDSLLPGWAAPEPWIGWYAAIEDLIDTLPASQFAKWQLDRLNFYPHFIGKTVLFKSGNTTHEANVGIAIAGQPSYTIPTAPGDMRAFIVHSTDQRSMPVRAADDPTFAVMAFSFKDSHAPGGMPRAWLAGDQAASHGTGVQLAIDSDPAFTLTTRSSGGTQPRAWLSQGRVVRMTPRALARFQSLPDGYMLPDKAGLACTVIGNMVPSLMIQKIVEPLL